MITVISAWYNEEDLARLFLNHYSFADQIIIMLDESTNDGTLGIIREYQEDSAYRPFISFRTLRMPNGLDDVLKRDQLNQQYAKVGHGWVIVVDCDEFILLPPIGMQKYLDHIEADVVLVNYFQMYQHESELALDKVTPIFEQRQYGKLNGLTRWKKPSVARAGKNFIWSVGLHEVRATNSQVHVKLLPGAHWSMADVNLSIKRRINNHRNHMSEANKRAKLSTHNFTITEDKIRQICNENNDCKQVFTKGGMA